MVEVKRKAVFLDRDGIVNQAIIENGRPMSPRIFQEFVFTDDIFECVKRLKSSGYILAVITNQPDISRKKMEKNEMESMHDMLRRHLKINDVFVCIHDTNDNCNCRKPKPGLIFEAAHKLNVKLNDSFLIGDRNVDIQAAQAAGVYPIFIDLGYAEARPSGKYKAFDSVIAGVDWICEASKETHDK